jgi:hypothetical protein
MVIHKHKEKKFTEKNLPFLQKIGFGKTVHPRRHTLQANMAKPRIRTHRNPKRTIRAAKRSGKRNEHTIRQRRRPHKQPNNGGFRKILKMERAMARA